MLWKPYTRSGSFLYQRDVKIVHDFDAIFLIYKPIIDVLMKKSSLIDLNVFRKESAIASGVELAVKTAVLLTALPLLNRLLSLLQEVLLL